MADTDLQTFAQLVLGRKDVEISHRMDEGLDPSMNDNMAVQFFAAHESAPGFYERLLSDPRVDPSADKNYAIRFASSNGYTDKVQSLLAHPAVDPTDNNNLAILRAADRSQVSTVKLLYGDQRVRNSVNVDTVLARFSEQTNIADLANEMTRSEIEVR